MNEPKISVIVPIYNAEKHLEKCLQSLIGQSFFSNMELLLINDGSTDGSGAIIDRYCQIYPQIKCYHIANGGVSNARNLGLSHACGEYVTFVDSDDWVDLDCYEAMYAHSEAGKADLIAAGILIDTGDKVLLSIHASETVSTLSGKEAVIQFLRGDLDVHVINKLFKRTIACRIRFNRAVRIGEDKLFLYEYLTLIDQVRLMPACFYHYYQNSNSVMHQAFSEKCFDNIPVCQRIAELTEQVYPDLKVYAECMNINALCRILGDISLSPESKTMYQQQYKNLLHQVRKFSIFKSIRHSSKKHWASLLIAKLSPKLYGRLRGNNRLRYIKA